MNKSKQKCEELFERLLLLDEEFKTKKLSLTERIFNQYEFMIGEIDIVIESFKMKLDDIGQSLKKKLNFSKTSVQQMVVDMLPDCEQIESLVCSFKQDIENNEFNSEKLDHSCCTLVELESKLNDLKAFSLKLDFIPNEDFEITEDLIGLVYCSCDNLFAKLGNPEYIQLDYKPTDCFELKNGNILIGAYTGFISTPCSFALYDSDFRLIRIIDSIDLPFGIAWDANDNSYMTNSGMFKNAAILSKYNQDFELITSTQHSTGQDFGDIFVYKEKIYACTRFLKQIEVYSLNLEHMSTHRLTHQPNELKITNDLACLSVANADQIFEIRFYRLPSFDYVNSFVCTANQCGSLLAFNKMFYVVCREKCHVFDQNGRLVESTKRNSHKNTNPCDKINNSNTYIFEMLFNDRRICKFKILQ